ncbi:response regulator transcription factor [Candidatus Bipolaricaulota bacterium]|nr:response regulator transcription factor [Candidatus Bipolaricaulota bacterium]
MGEPVRAVIADDHPVALAGLEEVLQRAGIAVVGRARTGREALSLLRQFRPDVAVVDVALPELSGLEVTRRARELGVPVVLVSMYDVEALMREAVKAGAAAFVSKMALPQEIVDAVRSAAEGKALLNGAASPEATHHTSLTPREREVVKLLAEGRKLREIAEILCRSPATVRAQKASAMRKLGVHSTAELIRRARELGIFPP